MKHIKRLGLQSWLACRNGEGIQRNHGAWTGSMITLIILAICTPASGADRLESVEQDLIVTKLHRAYHKLWNEQLLVRDAMLQFVSAPAGGGHETGLSIVRADNKPNRFNLVVKEATSSLWTIVIANADGAKARAVDVKTCKVPLPESTALAAYRAWLKMLERIDPAADQIVLDSTREIFFVRTLGGRTLRGRLPLTELGKNTRDMFEIAGLLRRSCGESGRAQAQTFVRIEKLSAIVATQAGRSENRRR
jgi:hypothetical protein